jgi:hypothetical protein
MRHNKTPRHDFAITGTNSIGTKSPRVLMPESRPGDHPIQLEARFGAYPVDKLLNPPLTVERQYDADLYLPTSTSVPIRLESSFGADAFGRGEVILLDKRWILFSESRNPNIMDKQHPR